MTVPVSKNKVDSPRGAILMITFSLHKCAYTERDEHAPPQTHTHRNILYSKIKKKILDTVGFDCEEDIAM